MWLLINTFFSKQALSLMCLYLLTLTILLRSDKALLKNCRLKDFIFFCWFLQLNIIIFESSQQKLKNNKCNITK